MAQQSGWSPQPFQPATASQSDRSGPPPNALRTVGVTASQYTQPPVNAIRDRSRVTNDSGATRGSEFVASTEAGRSNSESSPVHRWRKAQQTATPHVASVPAIGLSSTSTEPERMSDLARNSNIQSGEISTRRSQPMAERGSQIVQASSSKPASGFDSVIELAAYQQPVRSPEKRTLNSSSDGWTDRNALQNVAPEPAAFQPPVRIEPRARMVNRSQDLPPATGGSANGNSLNADLPRNQLEDIIPGLSTQPQLPSTPNLTLPQTLPPTAPQSLPESLPRSVVPESSGVPEMEIAPGARSNAAPSKRGGQSLLEQDPIRPNPFPENGNTNSVSPSDQDEPNLFKRLDPDPAPRPPARRNATVPDCDKIRDFAASTSINQVRVDSSPNFVEGFKNKNSQPSNTKSSFASSAAVRTWRAITGETIATGRLVDLAYGSVVLELEDGSRMSYLVRKLSDPDQVYVSESWGIPVTCTLGDQAFLGRSFADSYVTWKASGACHKPLYFEDVQLERCGHEWGPVVQPAMSSVRFFKDVAVLPYKMGIHPMNECQYALGYYRPGSCAPWTIGPVPISLRGALMEAKAVTGVAWALP